LDYENGIENHCFLSQKVDFQSFLDKKIRRDEKKEKKLEKNHVNIIPLPSKKFATLC